LGKGVFEFLEANPNIATSLLSIYAGLATAKAKGSGLSMIKKKKNLARGNSVGTTNVELKNSPMN
jgi:hypothetical protein